MTKSPSHLKIWARSRSRLRSRLHHWCPLQPIMFHNRQNSLSRYLEVFCLRRQNR